MWAEVLFQNHVCDRRGCTAFLQVCTPSGRTAAETVDVFVRVFPNLILLEDLIKWAVIPWWFLPENYQQIRQMEQIGLRADL